MNKKNTLIILASILFVSNLWANKTLQVVTTIKPLYALVNEVVGEHGQTKLLIDQSQSPHNFQLKPSQVSMLEDADVIFYIDKNLETFLDKIQHAQKIAMTENVSLELLPYRKGGVWENHHGYSKKGYRHGRGHHKHGYGKDHHKHSYDHKDGGVDYDMHSHEDEDDKEHDYQEHYGEKNHHGYSKKGYRHGRGHHKHGYGKDHHKHSYDHKDGGVDYDMHSHEDEDEDDKEHDYQEHYGEKNHHGYSKKGYRHGRGHHKHGYGKDHHKYYQNYDVHIWLDPEYAIQMVEAIANTLGGIDAENNSTYQDNASKLIEKIRTLDTELSQQLKPIENKPFMVFHDAYHYFEKAYKLDGSGSVTIHPDEHLSLKRIMKLRKKIKQKDIVCIFSEPQFPNKIVSSIVQDTNTKSAVLDPLGTDLDIKDDDLYIKLLTNLANQYEKCLS